MSFSNYLAQFMKLSFTLRSLGKKRPLLENLELDIAVTATSTIQNLLEKIVEQQVTTFNANRTHAQLIDFLNEDVITQNANIGSVKFNEQYNQETVDLETAQRTVTSAFEDGLIALFVNDNQFESLQEEISLNEYDSIKLIRLTFLAGRSW